MFAPRFDYQHVLHDKIQETVYGLGARGVTMQFLVDKLLDSTVDTGVTTASTSLGRPHQFKKLIDIPTVEQGVVHHFAALDELVDQDPAAEIPSRKLEQGATERPYVERV